ncbi:hypothetical protein BDV26DRAFT_273217 [Aspergillus bertholletiae]|uniref:Uncharacterized protein n=1 Tax=Aspergillus bertholletiae TaxID=1226010 RepID=A0A5N7AT27_9EURO|nr:hypothetical protein BDV26DRAFT_273217 [Aspergillus bertholletiae]
MAEAGTPFQLFRLWVAGNSSTLVRGAVMTSTIRYRFGFVLWSRSFGWSLSCSFLLLLLFFSVLFPSFFFSFFFPFLLLVFFSCPQLKSRVKNDSISKDHSAQGIPACIGQGNPMEG